MKYDLYRFTKFGLINALLSLIPIFPAWTLFPGVAIAAMLEKVTGNCELAYQITLWGSFGLTAGLLIWYFRRFEIDGRTEKQLRKEFRLISLAVYTLTNFAILLLIVGTNCYGDGQTLLAFIYSGPLASVGLIILGFGMDVKVSIIVARAGHDDE